MIDDLFGDKDVFSRRKAEAIDSGITGKIFSTADGLFPESEPLDPPELSKRESVQDRRREPRPRRLTPVFDEGGLRDRTGGVGEIKRSGSSGRFVDPPTTDGPEGVDRRRKSGRFVSSPLEDTDIDRDPETGRFVSRGDR